MPADHLRSEARGLAKLVTLHRPERRNSLEVALVRDLADAIAAAPAEGARTVVITGAPPAFCAGGDLADRGAVGEAAELAALRPAALARTKAALRRGIDAELERELATLGATQGTLLTSQAFRDASTRFRK